MTPAEKVHMLEVERAMVLPGRNSGALDTPERCAARLNEAAIASAEFDTVKSQKTKRRAHHRARRQAAGR